MANEVTFPIKLLIDGKERIVEATADVKKLAKVVEDAGTESMKLRDELLKFTQSAQVFRDVLGSLQGLTSEMREYTDAYNEQVVAETKLAVNMRNMMDATDAEVESIKALCAAQQELGVIGDEVQLAGAQELATYLQKKSSLEELIPVMNDMLAQQYGLNATQEEAATIAQMLGKVMEGQVGALSRYGYYFDEAQEQVLRFGTEEERAATLAEVVESAVGGMNAELAKTDAGQAKKTADAIGDIKEKVGEVLIPLGQLMEGLDGIAAPVSHILSLGNGIAGATTAMKNMSIWGKISSATQAVWNYQMRLGQQASIAWAFGAKVATVQALALRGAILGLMAVSGVGLAFAAVSTVMSLFGSKAKDATKDMEDAKNAQKDLAASMQEATSNAYSQAASALEVHKQKLKALIEAKQQGKDVSKDEKKAVKELNDAYGGTMGYFDSVAKWYEALIANSETYCKQMILEAKTRMLANQIAEKEMEMHDIRYDEKGNIRRYSNKRKKVKKKDSIASYHMGKIGGEEHETTEGIVGSSAVEKAQKTYNDLSNEKKALEILLEKTVKEAGALEFKVKGSTVRPDGNGGKNGDDNIKDQEKKEEEERKREEKWQKRIRDAEKARREAALKAAEEEQKLREKEIEDMHRYLEEYGSYEQKRLAITEEYEAKIRAAKNPWEAESLKAEMKEQISAAKLDEVKSEMDWEGLFNNLDRYSADFLQGIRGKLQELLRSGELDAKDSEIVAQKLEEIDKVVIEKSGSTFRWINEYLAEQKRLQEEAAQAASEADAARARKAGAMAGLDGARDKVEQLKANGVAENSLEMQTALNELARAEAEAASATAELTKAEGKQTSAEAKLNVPLKEKVAGWLQGVNENVEKYLGDVPELFEQLGWGDIANRVQSGIDGVNQAAGAAKDFAKGNYVGALSKGISAITSFAGLLGGGNHEEEYQRILSDWAAKTEANTYALQQLTAKMGDKSLTVDEAKQAKDDALAALGGVINSLRGSAHAVADDSSDGGLFGIGGYHSWYHERGDWDFSRFNSVLAAHGSSERVYDDQDVIWRLSPDAINILRSYAGDAWNDYFGYVGSKRDPQEIKRYLEQIGDLAEKDEEIMAEWYSQLTNMTFDELRDSFKSLIMDMDKEREDFLDSWNSMKFETAVDAKMRNSGFNAELEQWQKDWGEAIANGWDLSGLNAEFERLTERALEIREEAMTESGYRESSTQTGRSGGFTAMSQDQGTKLEGMFTSGLMHWASMDERMENVSEKMGKASDHLSRIEENTSRSAKTLEAIREQGEKLLRDGIRVK